MKKIIQTERNCLYCNNSFMPSTNQVRKAIGKYCSRKCGRAMQPKPSLEERIWNKIVKTENKDDCWIFKGARSRNGYGKIIVDGKLKLAHRMLYIINNGPISKELVIMHTCDNPPCCNPNHLKLGTQGDNNRDCVNKKRRKYFTRTYHHNSVFNNIQIKKITSLYTGKRGDISKLAREYGVVKTTISNILKRERIR